MSNCDRTRRTKAGRSRRHDGRHQLIRTTTGRGSGGKAVGVRDRSALANAAIIQSHIDMLVTDTAIDFAIHVRRILDNNGIRTKFAATSG